MAAYYAALAIIRFSLLKHTQKHDFDEKLREQWKKYFLCGIMLLVINFVLAGIIVYIVWKNKTFVHHEITTIALAAYTFLTFTFAIINGVKYRKYNSPVYSAAKIITLVCACVSVLTLETTMLTTFGTSNVENFRTVILGATGAAITVFTTVTATYMIVRGKIELKKEEKARD